MGPSLNDSHHVLCSNYGEGVGELSFVYCCEEYGASRLDQSTACFNKKLWVIDMFDNFGANHPIVQERSPVLVSFRQERSLVVFCLRQKISFMVFHSLAVV